MKSRVSSTVTKRTSNPRPRKYASASERQAAYRARAPEVCFRAEQKTVETLDRIAETLDQSRADVLLSMTKFALANHDWARFGLTHKPLPFEYGVNPLKLSPHQRKVAEVNRIAREHGLAVFKTGNRVSVETTDRPGLPMVFDDYDQALKHLRKLYGTRKTNPMTTTRAKRKPTPAQLAARERFAEMARSGALKRKTATKRRTNPQGRDAGEFRMTVDGKSVTRFFVHATDEWALSYGFPYRLLSNVVDFGAPIKFGKTRATVAIDEGPDGRPVTETWEIRALKFYDGERKTNPARKAAGVRRNPASTAPFKFVCIAPLEYSGSKYGIDERTPVTLKFAKTEPAASTVYACYQLPASVVKNDDFQNFAYHNKVLYMSIAQLRTVLKGYAK